MAGLDVDVLIAVGRLVVVDPEADDAAVHARRHARRRVVRVGWRARRPPGVQLSSINVRLRREGGSAGGKEGNDRAVDALEDLWNALAEAQSFALLCGHASCHFAAARGDLRLRAACSHHTCVHQSNDDLLANWLLSTAALNGSDE